MHKQGSKYAAIALVAAVCIQMVFAASRPQEASGKTRVLNIAALALAMADTVKSDTVPVRQTALTDSIAAVQRMRQDSLRRIVGEGIMPIPIDTVPEAAGVPADSVGGTFLRDSLAGEQLLPIDNFLDQPISGKNTDSLVYKVRDRLVFIHKDGDVHYGSMELKADYIRVDMDKKELYAHGELDTAGVATRPEFIESGTSYVIDTIAYNIESEKAKIKGVVTQDGDGFLQGKDVKKVGDVLHIHNGRYTTCDCEEPHFYLALTKGKVLPGEKVIVGPSYLVMEDVPIYFLGVPEAFFPLSSGRSSGFKMPSYGEENARGFFLRDFGYYFAVNDYVDITVLGSIYTKGSWEAKARSNYIKRYKYRGNFSFEYSKTLLGEKGLADYQNYGSYKIAWSHTQDAKANPGSTFSASVNFQTTNYAKYGSETITDYVNAQTSSRISYSKNWAGTPFSMSASFGLDQSRRDSTYSLQFPNISVNMSRVNPFKRKNAVGKERWYEKIALTYSGQIQNSVKTKEADIFTEQMFKDMINGVKHSIPITMSFNVLNHLNVTPNINYGENWYFKKIEKNWNPVTQTLEEEEPEYGFWRTYNYNVGVSASTKIYGDWAVSDKYPNFFLRRMRHTITPTIGFSWAPDFQDPKYGFYKPIQRDSTGNIQYYSPYSGAFGVQAGGKQGLISFGLAQTLELKVKDDSDTTGMRKIKFIDNFSFNGSYNLLADEFKLSKISLNLRVTVPFIKNFQLNLSGVLDPYQVIRNEAGNAERINKLMIRKGKLGRLESTGWSFSYTFNGGKEVQQGAINDTGGYNPLYDEMDPFNFDPNNPMDPMLRRQLMTQRYYDFSVPWSFSFNYSVSYKNDGVKKTISQTLGFNGSVTLTKKWGISFSGFGFDFDNMKLTPGSFNLTRDLHCWQMNFNWVPIGTRKSWSFNISVKSSLLRDLKYDKSSSYLDNIYGQTSR